MASNINSKPGVHTLSDVEETGDMELGTQVGEDDNLMGKVVNSEDEAYALYNAYALRVGFSIRKGKVRYFTGSKKIRSREYFCSKEGFKLDEDLEEKKVRRLDTRTGCKAFVRFSNEDGLWKVVAFNPQHNHELAMPSEKHLLKSARRMPISKAHVPGVEGFGDIGFVNRDCYTYMNRQKTLMSAGDSQNLLNLFKSKQAEDSLFFYTVQVDQENRITNFFWRDGRSRLDYDCFGDVLAFDTTCRTNKYNLICAPFVGVNHHWQNVMFGCAFMLDETTTSFEWLFKSFLESMGNRPPKTILTDHNQAISNAIEIVFPNTRHCLCRWHILKSVASQVGDLSENSEFKYLFNKCLTGCEEAADFQQSWDNLIQKYNIGNHKWFNTLYEVRAKWSTAFTKDVFTGGISSSQRSESTGNVLVGLANDITSLSKFVIAYEKLVASMRSSEFNEDFRCKQGAQSKVLKKSGILGQASNVYTNKIYKLFEEELLGSIGTTWTELVSRDTLHTFEVREEGSQRVCTVKFNSHSAEIFCSCKKFESLGILCCHALRVFGIKNLTRIPNQYVLKRWTKEAKGGMMGYEQSAPHSMNRKDELVWRNSMIRFVCNSIYKAQGMDTARKLCIKKLLEFDREIDEEVARLKLGEERNLGTDIANEGNDACTPVLCPSHMEDLSSTRHKGHCEKRKTNPSKEAISAGKSKQSSHPILLPSIDINSRSQSNSLCDQHHMYPNAPLSTHTQSGAVQFLVQ
ncbi:protein FAR1-RELATED SEQUENCE 5 isoform X4 [Ziziphus jujuba]|uniref:Protein FAR1-RELATED SEQUENCE 5 isoform X4 n=1 Tax=Ziziphus jujuba TaxID=326968 RepID=A0ABM3I5C9_ZIZJJ|nr:protein FAR1-RELATED SEQUENCE 5 isoform X4 [Ziziphus jujuba]